MPPLQRRVAGVLLRCFLPDAAAQAGANAEQLLVGSNVGMFTRVSQLVAVLSSGCLQAAAVECMSHTDAAAAVRHAGAILRTLPASRPHDVPATVFCHVTALELLAFVCSTVAESCSSNEGSTGSSGAGGSGSSGAGGSSGAAAAAWELVRLVPLCTGFIQTLAADNACCYCTPAVCVFFSSALQLLPVARLNEHQATPAQLVAWAEAAEAGVRLQPLMERLDGDRPQQHAQQQAQHAQRQQFAALAGQLLVLLSNPPRLQRPVGSAGGTPALRWTLWRLHSAVCRLVHWHLAGGTGTAGFLRQLIVALGGLYDLCDAAEEEHGGCAGSVVGMRCCRACHGTPSLEIIAHTACSTPLHPSPCCLHLCSVYVAVVAQHWLAVHAATAAVAEAPTAQDVRCDTSVDLLTRFVAASEVACYCSCLAASHSFVAHVKRAFDLFVGVSHGE